ncbi:MAG: hypothetical protein EPO18_06765 [Methylobacter sp.]|nr:MAG: hypothetical protein EPO18_06765 [Methylobacter sp.]
MPTWTDICSCNICIHHIHVDYVGKGREHDCMDAGGRATQGAVAEERKLFRQHNVEFAGNCLHIKI